MDEMDKIVNIIEQGKGWEDTDEVVQIEVKKPLDRVIPVRLPSEKWEQLRREAKELGIGPTTLARMWILKELRLKVTSLNTFEGEKLITINNHIVADKGINAKYDIKDGKSRSNNKIASTISGKEVNGQKNKRLKEIER
jgi:hypothetical protein